MRRVLMLAAGLLVGCETGANTARVTVPHLSFEVPSHWERSDETRRGLATAVYTPPRDENERKESVVVSRTELAPAAAKEGIPAVERLLAQAEGGLRDARVTATQHITTLNGLSGAVITVDFTPAGIKTRYRRTHAVLIDGKALVHVMYTARTPDPNMFEAVLSSVRHEES